ncbi:MAG: hypothetical protein LBP88_05230 [Treponema sp.]|nr:hypothetical protein [Treponema sp.]
MSGRGGARRRGYRRRERTDTEPEYTKPGRKTPENSRSDRGRGSIYERLRWTPPVVVTEPLPVPDCPYCGKPIKDLATAVADKHSDRPVHFDCIIAKIAESETLEKEDSLAYIGGGCFGILKFTGSHNTPGFTIKKVVEWEDREQRAPWRKTMSDRYSTT